MAIAHEFGYLKPRTLSEAVKTLSKAKNASVLAGGTDIVVKIKDGTETPDVVVDIKGIGELKKLKFENKKLFVGACVTFTEMIESGVVREKFPLLWEASKTVASVGIRNRATLVGNICSA